VLWRHGTMIVSDGNMMTHSHATKWCALVFRWYSNAYKNI